MQAGDSETLMREIDLTSRVKYFGPTSTLSRTYSGTPVFAPAVGMEVGSVRERPLMEFDDAGVEAALSKFERFDDQIMGGISQSNIVRGLSQAGEPVAIFGGVVRVQGGGFAGCRMKMLQAPLDLSDSTGVYIKCRGDGKRYKLNMRSSPTSNEVVYQAEFTPPQDAMATVRIPFSAFRLVKRSVPISGPPLGINTIYQMGLVLSKFSFGEDDFNPTFQPGLFRLELAEIGTFTEPKQQMAYVDVRSGAQRVAPLKIPEEDMIQDSLKYKADGKKRSWLKRFLFGRVRKALRGRVAARRTEVAKDLLEARKQGVRLSEWRKNTDK